MSTADELIARLAQQDIRLSLEGDKLTVNAPKGALTGELREELGRRKDEIKQHLAARAAGDVASTQPAGLVRVARTGAMALSHTQARLWFVRQLDPSSSLYNIIAVLRLRGALDVTALQGTLQALVDRHESLRTQFFAIDGEPRCTILAQAPLQLEQVDLTGVEPAQREARAMDASIAFSRRPFDLTQAPLLTAQLVRLTAEHHLFTFVMDHIVADGMSLGIFLGELQLLYAQLRGHGGATLEPLAAQYIDYVDWEQRRFERGALTDTLAYWKRRLAGAPSLLQLPTDRPRPPILTPTGARCARQLSPALSQALKALAREERATLFMVLYAAFAALLHRYTGETDVVIGSVTGNRHLEQVERTIGFFANNLALRADLSGRPTVRDLIGRARSTALEAFAHQDMPFDRLVDALGASRELDRTPLFQVLFVLQNLRLTELQMPGLEARVVELPLTGARFDLAVDVFDLDAGLRVYMEYRSSLFDEATIERWLGHYERLLEGFAARPGAHVDELPILGDAERRTVLVDWNHTAAPWPAQATVHGLFEAQAQRTPQATALRFGDEAVSYAELNARANRLAHHLRAMGVQRESLVGVWLERSVEMVVAVLGVLKAGGAYVPLDPAFPRDRIDYMMSDARLSALVTQAVLATGLGADAPRAVLVDTDAAALAAQPAHDPAPLSGPQDLAYVIYTSGSTGRPKGVMLEHRSVVNFLHSMHREPGIAAGDRFVAVTTLSFDIAGLEIHGPLTVGATVVLASRATALDGRALAELLEGSGATILQATPATWRLLLDSGWAGRPGLKMLCGGEALPRELAARLTATGGELWNMYGPTETTIWSTLWRVDDASRAISIGRPIANTQVYVLEPSGLPAAVGVGGELCIGGDGLARGYLLREELTAEKFVTIDLPEVGRTRVYRTGDVVRWLPDGRLEFAGRRDHQVKVRGFRIELGEIEAVLATHAGVRENVVSVREDSPGDQRLVAYVVLQPDQALDLDAVRATLRTRLPEYMVPNQFVTLPALPLTPNGKVDRRALPAPAVADEPAAGFDDMQALMTPEQQRVAACWREVLRIERVGLHSNFFDLGGHSLLLVRLQVGLQRAFGRELPLIELFQHTTVAAQAARLSAGSDAAGAVARARARAVRQVQI